jgi:hypothetical protein
MKNISVQKLEGMLMLICIGLFHSCSKSDSGGSTPADPCSGKTINITASVTQNADPCSKGIISVSATGSTGFTYSVDGNAYQASGTFNDITAGNHNISAKDGSGCIKTASVTVTNSSAGTLFTAVKSMMQTNCAVSGCHNGTQSPNFTEECNIVNNWSLIKTRAVDGAGTSNQMPQPPLAPLSQVDRDKISSWVNAGHKFSN